MHLFIPQDSRPIHFVGIAGAGMRALALLARRAGATVTGCDAHPVEVEDLSGAGIDVRAGHAAEHVSGARAVVYTSALPADHAELRAARAAGIPVLRRAEALQELVCDGTVVGVSGTHGKTTTTVMTTAALVAAGADPSGIAGGRVAEWGGNARQGGSDLFVVEADEYDRSFLELYPHVATVTNVEADHLECYGSMDALEEAFRVFCGRAQRVLVGADDRGASRLGRDLTVPVWRVGTSPDADVRLSDVRSTPEHTAGHLELPNGRTVELIVTVPGLHNLRNGAMAVGVACALGYDERAAAKGVRRYTGVGRRFEVLGTWGGVTVVDDYAHHPTEVAVTVAAARQRFPGRRLVTVFQPHLFSRTQALGDAMGIALSTADLVIVTEVYPAREQPIPGVSGRNVARAAERAGADVEWIPTRAELTERLPELVSQGDIVLTLGAGDITDVGRLLVKQLEGAAA